MNEMQFPILSLITFLPLFGALLLLTIRTSGNGEDALRNSKNAYNLTLFITAVTFALSCFMYGAADLSSAGFAFTEKYIWISSPEITFELGVDGLSVYFVLLTAFLVPAALLIGRNAVKERLKEYCLAFLALETMVIGSFLTPDLLFFYIFFEGALIPMFLIIGIWGGARRIYASFKFFLFTLTGSILMLVGLVYIITQTGSTDFEAAAAHSFSQTEQIMLFLAFFASFAIKVPMWPFHTWLPDAHVEAPTAGSVILAGVLLKMGGYGFLRFSVPLFPLGVQFFAPYLSLLAVIAVIYASLTAYAQTDMKKTVAYSSVAHMGFVILGIFSLSIEGISGAVFQMVSHGVISAALFMSVGVLYERFHTREIARYGGMVNVMPRFAVLLMIFVLGSVGLPGTSGFVGEFLTLTGTYLTRPVYALFAVTGVVLGAVYMLALYKRLMFGTVSRPELTKAPDVNSRELAVLSICAFLVLALGTVSYKITDVVKPVSEATVSGYYKALNGKTAEINGNEKGGNVNDNR